MRPTNGYPYRYELHCHTCRCSKCAHSTPVEMARAYYHEKGYAWYGHHRPLPPGQHGCGSLPVLGGEDELLPQCLSGSRLVCGRQGFSRALRPGTPSTAAAKEVLTYGIDLEFLLSHPVWTSFPQEYRPAGVGRGLPLHGPSLRGAAYIDSDHGPQPDCLDGAGAFSTPARKTKAALLVEQHHLLPTSGGDVHDAESDAVGMAGLPCPGRLPTERAGGAAAQGITGSSSTASWSDRASQKQNRQEKQPASSTGRRRTKTEGRPPGFLPETYMIIGRSIAMQVFTENAAFRRGTRSPPWRPWTSPQGNGAS